MRVEGFGGRPERRVIGRCGWERDWEGWGNLGLLVGVVVGGGGGEDSSEVGEFGEGCWRFWFRSRSGIEGWRLLRLNFGSGGTDEVGG